MVIVRAIKYQVFTKCPVVLCEYRKTEQTPCKTQQTFLEVDTLSPRPVCELACNFKSVVSCVCVCACVRACVRVCVRVCVFIVLLLLCLFVVVFTLVGDKNV